MIQKIIDRLFGKSQAQKPRIQQNTTSFEIEPAGSGFKIIHGFYAHGHHYKLRLYLPKSAVVELRDKINIALDQTVDFDQPA